MVRITLGNYHVEPQSRKARLWLVFIITARRSYASAVLGVVILSVCPSVCHTRGLGGPTCFVSNSKNTSAIFLCHILITANMQLKTGFPSSHQLKSYVAPKSRLKFAARCPVSSRWPSCVVTVVSFVLWLGQRLRYYLSYF